MNENDLPRLPRRKPSTRKPAAPTGPTLDRKTAASLIEALRETAVSTLPAERKLRLLVDLLADAGLPALEVCDGAAHRVGDGEANGFQDNCTCCAPRWGFLGDKVVVR